MVRRRSLDSESSGELLSTADQRCADYTFMCPPLCTARAKIQSLLRVARQTPDAHCKLPRRSFRPQARLTNARISEAEPLRERERTDIPSASFKITDANYSQTQRIYLRDSSRFGMIDFGMLAGSTSSHSTSNVPTKPNSGPQNSFLTSHSILYLPIASSNQT